MCVCVCACVRACGYLYGNGSVLHRGMRNGRRRWAHDRDGPRAPARLSLLAHPPTRFSCMSCDVGPKILALSESQSVIMSTRCGTAATNVDDN